MSHDKAYMIRPATAADTGQLSRLAQLDSQRPLGGRIVVVEVDGTAVAARSLDERRTVADPFRLTADAVAKLSAHARMLGAANGKASFGERLRWRLRAPRPRPATVG